MTLAVSNLQYAFDSWTPGGALLGVLILVVIVLVTRRFLPL